MTCWWSGTSMSRRVTGSNSRFAPEDRPGTVTSWLSYVEDRRRVIESSIVPLPCWGWPLVSTPTSYPVDSRSQVGTGGETKKAPGTTSTRGGNRLPETDSAARVYRGPGPGSTGIARPGGDVIVVEHPAP